MNIEGSRYGGGTFSEGEALSASKLNDLSAAAARGQQWHSSGNLVAQGAFGTVDMSGAEIVTSQNYDYPFKVSVAPGDTAGKWNVYVRAGTVNSWIPKFLDGPCAGQYLDSVPTPYVEFSSASGSTKYVVLRCTNSGGTKFFPNTTTVYLVDSLESLADTNDEGHLLLAGISVVKEGGTIKSISSVQQHIYSAQSLIRIKPGNETALWNWTSR